MAFNSRTYHANKYAREAAAYLAEAREIKRAWLAGERHSWHDEAWLESRLRNTAKLAIQTARLSRMYRRHAAERKAWRQSR